MRNVFRRRRRYLDRHTGTIPSLLAGLYGLSCPGVITLVRQDGVLARSQHEVDPDHDDDQQPPLKVAEVVVVVGVPGLTPSAPST